MIPKFSKNSSQKKELTSFHYLTTEPLFIEAFTKWSFLSKIDMFECREAIYGRLCLKVVASVLAFIIQIALLVSMAIRVVEFQAGGTKLERILPKNQHTQNFANWVNAQVSKSAKI